MDTRHDIRLGINAFGSLGLVCKTPGHHTFWSNRCWNAIKQVREKIAEKLEIESYPTEEVRVYKKRGNK